jgi:hypothetical protein
LPAFSFPLAIDDRGDAPLYTENIEDDIRTMNRQGAIDLGGRMSRPSKMDCLAWGIPAKRGRLGSILAK